MWLAPSLGSLHLPRDAGLWSSSSTKSGLPSGCVMAQPGLCYHVQSSDPAVAAHTPPAVTYPSSASVTAISEAAVCTPSS